MEKIEVITTVQKRRRYTAQEKAQYVALSMQLGNSISNVAREYSIAPNQLYTWRKQMESGGIAAIQTNDQVVSLAQYNALLKKLKDTERMLGKKTVENEILKEAVEYAHAKKFISHMPSLAPDITPYNK